jgi:RNA polymerase sigma factor (TIGR02999 family)
MPSSAGRPPDAADRGGEVTALLLRWTSGDAAALERLVPLVYEELRQLARAYLSREQRARTLQPTALVHEAFLRLMAGQPVDWQDRSHFFGIAGRVMRQVLVDHARARGASKRGGGALLVAVEPAGEAGPAAVPEVDVLALHEALTRLATLDARQERLVELRYFAGLTIEETAEVLGASPATVKRDWVSARAWLLREMSR